MLQTRSGEKGEAAGHTPTHAGHPNCTLPPGTSLATLALPASRGPGARIPSCSAARARRAVLGRAQCLVNFPPYPKSDLSSIQGVVGGAF